MKAKDHKNTLLANKLAIKILICKTEKIEMQWNILKRTVKI